MGGYYELATCIGREQGIDAANELINFARVVGANTSAVESDGDGLLHLNESIVLACPPLGTDIPCGISSITFIESHDSWVYLSLSMDYLAELDPRVGGYPFGQSESLAWRHPLDMWLASIGSAYFADHRFLVAAIGFEPDIEETFFQPDFSTDRYPCFAFLIPHEHDLEVVSASV